MMRSKADRINGDYYHKLQVCISLPLKLSVPKKKYIVLNVIKTLLKFSQNFLSSH